MRRALMVSGLVVAAGLVLAWAMGALDALPHWIAGVQRAVQDRLASAVRAVRGGEAGAVWGLLALAFGYGLAHAAGPGHGKVLIGSYGVARRVALWRLAGLALVSSMAQAAVAVALVYGAVAVLGWTRDRVLGASEQVMAPLSHVLIMGLGIWLVWRGVAALRRRAALNAPHSHDHHHDHHHHDHHHHAHNDDCGCGHAHGPSLTEVEQLAGWRDTVALIAGIAMRPCSGALFLLILTWQLGIGGAGIAGAFAMGLGTALVTVAVAAMAVWAREGAFAGLNETRMARALPLIEIAAGAVIFLVAGEMLRLAI